MVNGLPHFIQGVCYYPIPIGYGPEVKYEQYRDTASDRQVWERDLNIISAMGANTIRMYGFDNSVNHSAFFNYALSKGIHVLVQYWWDTNKPLSDPSIKAGFIEMVTKQQHPAVGMWIIHNELNFKYTGSELDQLFDLFDNMVDEVIKIEGPNHRPVTTTLANVNNMIGTIQRYNNRKLTAWAVQMYSGNSFYNLFKDYAAVSSKPLIVSEFGIDAYDATKHIIDEVTQRDYDMALFQELYTNKNVTSGGTVFAYVDEWVKCGDYYSQDNCGTYNEQFPDKTVNEEYFGLFSATKNALGADILTPRIVVSYLTSLLKSNIPITQILPRTTTTNPVVPTTTTTNPIIPKTTTTNPVVPTTTTNPIVTTTQTSQSASATSTDLNPNDKIDGNAPTEKGINTIIISSTIESNSTQDQINMNNSLKLLVSSSLLIILYIYILFI